MPKKVLIVEDHAFFANEICEYLKDDLGFQVFYAADYLSAVRIISKHGPFDYTLLDVTLQNGKTGVDIEENYRAKLGKVMFITGSVDEVVLAKIAKFASASKLTEIWPKLEQFLNGGLPQIGNYESATYKAQRTGAGPLVPG